MNRVRSTERAGTVSYTHLAGIKLKRKYNLGAPKGVNGRNSENTLIKKYLNWEPDTSLRDGMEKTYAWIYDQFLARERGEPGVVRETFTAGAG